MIPMDLFAWDYHSCYYWVDQFPSALVVCRTQEDNPAAAGTTCVLCLPVTTDHSVP